jgi:glutathione S-transferase
VVGSGAASAIFLQAVLIDGSADGFGGRRCAPCASRRQVAYPGDAPEAKFVDDFLKARLERMEAVLAGREWLVAGRFTVADLLMADVLRRMQLDDCPSPMSAPA